MNKTTTIVLGVGLTLAGALWLLATGPVRLAMLPPAAAQAEHAKQELAMDIRDLQLPNMGQPLEGVITAGQPSPEAFEKLNAAGIKTVVSLRMPGEAGRWGEQDKAQQMGLRFVSIPIGGSQDLTRENVQKLADVLAQESGDILVYCGSSNRVGALLALRAAWLQGADVDSALELGRAAGLTSLADAVRNALQAG